MTEHLGLFNRITTMLFNVTILKDFLNENSGSVQQYNGSFIIFEEH